MANQRVYQILVYRHELFKINYTGVPSSSPPVSPRFFPALSLALFFARAPLSERLEPGGEGVLGSILAGYVPLDPKSPYPIIVLYLANYRPHLSHFYVNVNFANPT